MPSIVIHKNKKTGDMYAYESTSYRDPVTKKPRSKQVYLGKWDPVTETTIPTNRKKKAKTSINQIESVGSPTVTVTGIEKCYDTIMDSDINSVDSAIIETRIVGPSLLLDLVTKELNILPLLKKIFPENYLLILSLVYYITETGQAMYRIERWSLQHKHPYEEYISGPRISDLLLDITLDNIQNFLYAWLKKLNEEDILYYDITSISTYSKNINLARRGYNRDHESLDQINLSLLVGQQTKLPVHFRTLRGNLTDVTTLEKTFEYLNFLGIKKATFVLDRGFYSIKNISLLLEKRFHFLMSMPSNRIWIENIIDKYYDLIKMPIHYFHIGEGEHIFAQKHIDTWLDTGRRIYVHLYYQHDRINEDYQNFLENLAKLKEEIEEGKKPSQYLFNNYSKYLIITNTSNKVTRVEYNNEKILTYQKKYCGFYCLLSPNVKDAIEALKIYRNRDKVEKCFDDLKNSVDSKRIRVHTTTRIEARIFIQFLSLIYTSKIRSMLQKSSPIKNMSLQEIFDDLNILISTKIKRRFGSICTEADKRTQKILDFFEIQWPL